MYLQNGTAPGPSLCTEAVLALYGNEDACANAVRQLFSDETDPEAPSIFSIPGCQDRFNNAALYCNFDATNNNITEGNNRSSTSVSHAHCKRKCMYCYL